MDAVDTVPNALEAHLLDCMLAALPKGHMSISTISPSPFGPIDRKEPTQADVRAANDALFNAVLERLPRHLGRIIDIVTHLDRMSDKIFPDAVIKLEALSLKANRRVQRKIWEMLRREIARHRKCPEADWSMSDGRLTRLETWRDALNLDQEERLKWLFSAYWLQDFTQSHKDMREALGTARRKAVAKVFAQSGVLSLLTLVESVKEPELLGHSIGEEIESSTT